MTTTVTVHNSDSSHEVKVRVLYPTSDYIDYTIKPDQIKSFTLYEGLSLTLTESK